jgi:hypothetical protein
MMARSPDLPAQHRNLVAQHHELDGERVGCSLRILLLTWDDAGPAG